MSDRKPNSMMSLGIYAVMAMVLIYILSPVPVLNLLELNGASGLSTTLEYTLYLPIVWAHDAIPPVTWFYDMQQDLFEDAFLR